MRPVCGLMLMVAAWRLAAQAPEPVAARPVRPAAPCAAECAHADTSATVTRPADFAVGRLRTAASDGLNGLVAGTLLTAAMEAVIIVRHGLPDQSRATRNVFALMPLGVGVLSGVVVFGLGYACYPAGITDPTTCPVLGGDGGGGGDDQVAFRLGLRLPLRARRR